MKKFLSLLFVLVLSLSFVACGSTKVKGELVTDHDDVLKYFEDLDLDKLDEISYKFTIKYNYNEKTLEEQESEKYTVKGAFNYVTEDDIFYAETFKYSVDYKYVCTEATVDGKKKAKESSKSTVICDGDSIYASSKYSYKDAESSESWDVKEVYDFEYFILGKTPKGWHLASDASFESIFSLISGAVSSNAQFFINDDDMTIVKSTEEEHLIIKISCDGSDITAIECSLKTAFETTEISIKVCDEVDIKEPGNTSDYKDVNPED